MRDYSSRGLPEFFLPVSWKSREQPWRQLWSVLPSRRGFSAAAYTAVSLSYARMRKRAYLHQVGINRIAERATVDEIINRCDKSRPWDAHCVNQSTNMHCIQLRVLYDCRFSVCSRPSLYNLLHHALSAETRYCQGRIIHCAGFTMGGGPPSQGGPRRSAAKFLPRCFDV